MTPTVLRLRFSSRREIPFEPGQFVALVVPSTSLDEREVKRCYSLANPPEEARENGYEICVKYIPGGRGSEYLASLRPGDEIEVTGPHGEFKYEAPEPGRDVCFIATGTGVSPIRSMALSERFLGCPPGRALCLVGHRDGSETLYRKVFESVGIPTVHALSRARSGDDGFRGRVTDWLEANPHALNWARTDFYLCGNEAMVRDARQILLARGAHPEALRAEAFSAPRAGAKVIELPVRRPRLSRYRMPFLWRRAAGSAR